MKLDATPQDTEKPCSACQSFRDAGVFELCMSPKSEYRGENGRMEYHTTAHMRREHGICGPRASIFIRARKAA